MMGTPDKSKEKGVKCDVCGKVFAQQRHLDSHMLVHTGERPYKCDLCDSSYTLKSSLVRHTRKTHNPDKPDGEGSPTEKKVNGISPAKKKAKLSPNVKKTNNSDSPLNGHIGGSPLMRQVLTGENSIIGNTPTDELPFGQMLPLQNHSPLVLTCNTCAQTFTSEKSLADHFMSSQLCGMFAANDHLTMVFMNTVGGAQGMMNMNNVMVGPGMLLNGTPGMLGNPNMLNGGQGILNGAPGLLNGGTPALSTNPPLLSSNPPLLNGTPTLLNGSPSLLNGSPTLTSGSPLVMNGTPVINVPFSFP